MNKTSTSNLSGRILEILSVAGACDIALSACY